VIVPHDLSRTVKGVETHYRLFTYEYRRECGHDQVSQVPFGTAEAAEAHQEWTARQLCPECAAGNDRKPVIDPPTPREDDEEW